MTSLKLLGNRLVIPFPPSLYYVKIEARQFIFYSEENNRLKGIQTLIAQDLPGYWSNRIVSVAPNERLLSSHLLLPTRDTYIP